MKRQGNAQKDKRIQIEQMTKYTIWNAKKRKREYIKNRKEVTKKCEEKNQ